MQEKGFIAFEFNTSTIRLCRSVLSREGRKITHCLSLEAGDSEPETPRKIRDLIKINRFKKNNFVLMLPRYIAISRFLKLPAREHKEIEEMVRLRTMRETLASDLENIIYDWRLIGHDKEGYSLVTLFIARRDRINRYLEVMEDAGIMPEFVTLNTSGFLNIAAFPIPGFA